VVNEAVNQSANQPVNQMANESVIERITTILQDEFDVAPADAGVSANTEFEQLGVDSLVLVELALVLRREFGVLVTDEELVSSRTLGAAADLVTSRVARLG
jgi:acyl carrier protein